MNKRVYVIFLLNMLTKVKMNLFYKYEHKNKTQFNSHNKLKFSTFKLKNLFNVNCSLLFNVNVNCSVQC